ncbi:hypothetical protein ABK040_002583 [Willaertia magna]
MKGRVDLSSRLLSLWIGIIGWVLLIEIPKSSLSSSYQSTVTYGGRVSTYDLYGMSYDDYKTAELSESNTLTRKNVMSLKYTTTWCSIPFVNSKTNPVQYQKRQEICVYDSSSKKFYTVSDGYNVYQFNYKQNETLLQSVGNYNVLKEGNVRLPTAYNGHEFIIVNSEDALYVDNSTINGTVLLRSSDIRSDEVMRKEKYRFRIINHPSGKGVYISSTLLPSLCFSIGNYSIIDKMFYVDMKYCNTGDDKQRFYWTGTFLLTSIKINPPTNSLQPRDDVPYTLRFYSLMYGDSVGFAEINTRASSLLSLYLVTAGNEGKRPMANKRDVLSGDPNVEYFYNITTTPWVVNTSDPTLLSQISNSYIRFYYSSSVRTIPSIISIIVIYLIFEWMYCN